MIKVFVKSIGCEAKNIKTFELVDVSGSALPPFTAGAYIDVNLPGGFMRQYSLCNDPAETDRYLLAVFREAEGRGGSIAFHDKVALGDELEISAPQNNFPLDHRYMNYTMIAGGIGVAPLLAMAYKLRSLSKAFDFHMCVRSADQLPFKTELEELVEPDRLHFHITNGDPSRRLDVETLLAKPISAGQVYCCGPEELINAVGEATSSWHSHTVRFELFKPETLDGTDEEFDVKIASTGQVIRVGSRETILAALWKAGIKKPFSCELGICGTCRTPFIEGVPIHRDDNVLSLKEREKELTICVSRCKSPLLKIDI
jgi:vanillate O-demethylase ferredoxin subunit|tara:strand:- start:495 stop:1436 length:942 start_codon:yes stop_codon:yes gene_type:complete